MSGGSGGRRRGCPSYLGLSGGQAAAANDCIGDSLGGFLGLGADVSGGEARAQQGAGGTQRLARGDRGHGQGQQEAEAGGNGAHHIYNKRNCAEEGPEEPEHGCSPFLGCPRASRRVAKGAFNMTFLVNCECYRGLWQCIACMGLGDRGR
jgi:hypothetical protein